MAFHNNPRIVTDGLVLCADANARSSYPDAPATRGGDINTGWQDYGSNQANYVVLGKDSVKLIGSSTAWIGRFYAWPAAAVYTIMFDYVCDSGSCGVTVDNDGVTDNVFNTSLTATTTKQSFVSTKTITSSGASYIFIRRNSGSTDITISNFRYTRNIWNNLVGSNNDESLTLYNSTGFENWGLDTGPRCFTFDDTDDYGRTQDTLVPTANGTPLTLEAWAMTIDGGSGWQTVLGIHGTYTQIGFYNSSFRSGRNGGGGNSFLSSISISTNVWYHMALTINSAKTGIAYLDGVQVATGSVGTGSGSNGRFNLASYNGAGSEVLDGKIAAVRAYTRILSADDISQNYKAHKARFGK